MKAEFRPDANTSVVLVKAFAAGEVLSLTPASAPPTTPRAANDMCFVKLLVGPGNSGPAGAPSTSAGIGIEVWLPSPSRWNRRYHALGGGGFTGGQHQSTTTIGEVVLAPSVAGNEGAISSTTDTGKSDGTGAFAMLPDGTINQVLWRDFSERGIHEMAVKTKALARAYYLADPTYSYFDGFSAGGRQGAKLAQVYPEDFDGILAGAPVVNWTSVSTSELYPQIVYQRDLGGVPLTNGQVALVSNAAINACDVVGSQHLGYIPDPPSCRYDATADATVICAASGGSSTSPNCVNRQQALAINKIWYGMTADGSVPSPASDNGFSLSSGNLLWYGLGRGTSFAGLAAAAAFPTASTMVALQSQNSRIADPSFVNATGNGASLWRQLSYSELAGAFNLGLNLQPFFANINTDNPDLTAFRARSGRLLLYHGMADVLVPYPGTVNYYDRVAERMDGLGGIQSFSRLYLVPGMAHSFAGGPLNGNGTTNPNANPPLPTRDQLYQALVRWVETGVAPGRIEAMAAATATAPAKSRPLCPYPQRATFIGGDPQQTAAYECR